MNYFKVIYDVRDINELLLRELRWLLFGYSGKVDEDFIKVVLWAWYRVTIEELHCGLFFDKYIGELSVNGVDQKLTERIIKGVHPSFESIVYRMINIPPKLYDNHIIKINVTESDLILVFDKENKKEEIESALHITHKRYGSRPVQSNQNILSRTRINRTFSRRHS